MADNHNQNKEQQSYQVAYNEGLDQTGVYANVASVHVNSNEVILDFGYMVPNATPPQILINSRVNVSHATAQSFMSMFQNAMLDYKNKVDAANKAK